MTRFWNGNRPWTGRHQTPDQQTRREQEQSKRKRLSWPLLGKQTLRFTEENIVRHKNDNYAFYS
jgi:hypothetical protein